MPEQYHFSPGVALMVAGFDSAEDHAAAVAPIRAALPPTVDFVTPIPYTALQQMLDDSAPWGALGYEKALSLDEFSDAAIDVVVDQFPRKTSPMSFLPIFAMSGAFRDVADEDSAYGGSRSAGWMINIAAVAADPEAFAADRAWARAFWNALRPYASGTGSYVNFMTDYGDEERVRAAYGPVKYARLAAIKSKYDPDNVFHRNANIRPA
ncbi:BBE domain-containing protein [Actinomycetospora endophytica]|uniref:BBE domain-containing protein n=1 Tax=Actinomycetospora endophytica TaxID=2291215 RepID=UPI0027E35CE5|nr:BBE domain-containing protein [Actinomycetospora endophytica]